MANPLEMLLPAMYARAPPVMFRIAKIPLSMLKQVCCCATLAG
jgi:hypothetical protein